MSHLAHLRVPGTLTKLLHAFRVESTTMATARREFLRSSAAQALDRGTR